MKITHLLVVLVVAGAASSANALPNFARREGLGCNVCHTNIPRLSRFGYEYRNAGYRLPGKLGQLDKEWTFGDSNSAALRNEMSWTREKEGGVTSGPRGSIGSVEASLYPATGSFGKWFASAGEIALAPGEIDIENAYLRFTYGSDESHLNVRVGIIHPFEGYGASDRPVGLSSPLFQTSPAIDGATGTTTHFAPVNFNQAAVEVGYTYEGFNAVATVFNGLFVRPDGTPASFLGGDQSRPLDDPNYNAKDFQLFANQFFGDAGISAYWYHGTLTTPVPGGGANFTNRFDRLALYGTLPVAPKFWLLAGFQWGRDSASDVPVAATVPARFNSAGWFAEAYVPWSDYVGGSLRYDRFDPSRSTPDDLVQAMTLAANVAALDGAQAVVEYQHAEERAGPSTKITDLVGLRLVYVF